MISLIDIVISLIVQFLLIRDLLWLIIVQLLEWNVETFSVSVASDNKQKKTASQQPTNAAVLNKSNLDGNNMIKVVEQPSTANDKCECKIYTGLESVNSVMCLLGMQHTNTLCYLKYRRPYNIGHRFIDIFYSLK